MKLSKRRFEFLETLVDLVNQKGAPVHYIDVSEKMNVSKWTAYDMMRQLAEDGLVETSYSLNPSGSPGRSLVMFSPTRKGLSVVEAHRVENLYPQQSDQATQGDDEWQRAKDDLLNQIHMASEKEVAHSIDLTKDKYDSSPLAYCAALISLLIIEAQRKGLDLVALSGILEIDADKRMTLPLFTGLLIGSLLVRGARKLLPDLENLMHSFSHQVEQLEQANEDRLLEFIQTIVRKGASAQACDNTPAV
ncbi:MAG: hypothetical protein ACOX35_07440 [Bacillota bacterium]|nr:hypothetical protein [Candidatus Fermentithermobacillaceae bacterium]